MKIIDVGNIWHQIGKAAATCSDVTDTEDAVLLSDHARYPRIPIELTRKRSDTGIRTRQNMMHRKARTDDRCINMLANRISN